MLYLLKVQQWWDSVFSGLQEICGFNNVSCQLCIEVFIDDLLDLG